MSNKTQLTPESIVREYTNITRINHEALVFSYNDALRMIELALSKTQPTADTKVSAERKSAADIYNDVWNEEFSKYGFAITGRNYIVLETAMRFARQEVAHALAKQPQPGGDENIDQLIERVFGKPRCAIPTDLLEKIVRMLYEYGNQREAAAKAGWRPIEEAPRDFTSVQVGAFDENSEWLESVACWDGAKWNGFRFSFLVPTHFHFLLPAPPTIPNPTNDNS